MLRAVPAVMPCWHVGATDEGPELQALVSVAQLELDCPSMVSSAAQHPLLTNLSQAEQSALPELPPLALEPPLPVEPPVPVEA